MRVAGTSGFVERLRLVTIAWVIVAVVAILNPQVSREMALLNATAGTKAASWIVGLLLTFGPPLVVYALGLMIGRAFRGSRNSNKPT